MLYMVCYTWYAIHDMLYIACYIWHAIYGMLYMICYIWHAIYGMLYMACYIWHAICGMLYMACYTWYMACYIWHAIYGMLYMVCYTWYAIHGMLYMACYMLYYMLCYAMLYAACYNAVLRYICAHLHAFALRSPPTGMRNLKTRVTPLRCTKRCAACGGGAPHRGARCALGAFADPAFPWVASDALRDALARFMVYIYVKVLMVWLSRHGQAYMYAYIAKWVSMIPQWLSSVARAGGGHRNQIC